MGNSTWGELWDLLSRAQVRDATVHLGIGTKKNACPDTEASRQAFIKIRKESENQALASARAFFTMSSWNLAGTFWYLRNSMLKLPLPWVMLRRSFE